jgi:DNA-binding Lrp family transcriptional regulator
MSRTILANVDGFTPVIDTLVAEVGLMPAVVFGRMWRFCQGDRNECFASLSKISEDIGVDPATVMRHAKLLVENGYLEDVTPNLRNKPHTYRDTGKAGITNTIVAYNNTQLESIAHRNVTLQAATSHCTESVEDSIKKQVNREVGNEEPISEGIKNPPVRTYDPDIQDIPKVKKINIKVKKVYDESLYPLASMIASLCQLDIRNGSRGECFAAAKLLANGINPPKDLKLLIAHFGKGAKVYSEFKFRNRVLSPMEIVKLWPRLSGSVTAPEIQTGCHGHSEEA